MCESIKHLLVLWDMILSLVHTEYPSDEDCNRTQDFIDAAISIGDKLGMSRTIKIHGCMSHIVSQMRRIPCGLSDFDENFMEQYHQKGAGYDVRLKHVKNVEKKGNIVAARLRRSEHPETRAAIQRMVEQHSKGKRKKTKESEEAKQLRKKEKWDTYELPERLVNELDASDAANGTSRLVNELVASDAAVGTSGNGEVEEGSADAPKQEWVQCDGCEKWRRVSPQISAGDLPDVWYCSMNTWDKNLASCTVLEDK